MTVDKHSVKIKFERLKCPLCKHSGDLNIVINAEIVDKEFELKEFMVREINRQKQDKTTCLKCGFRIPLKKAKRITWKEWRAPADSMRWS